MQIGVAFDSSTPIYANSSIKGLVKNYTDKLELGGLTLENVETVEGGSLVSGVKGRLMWGTNSSGEFKTLKDAGYANMLWVVTNNYWLGSSYNYNDYVNLVDSGISCHSCKYNHGLRPVIKVLASRIG